MKKIISILLVAMLIIGMFPATALTAKAADTYEKATSIAVGDTVILVCESKSMEMSTIGSQKYGEGKAYSGAPTGLVPLTVEEGYTSGTYSFKAPTGTYLYWTSGNYLQLNANKTANTSWTVTFSSGNAVIKNAKDTSRQIQWNASSPRFSTYTSTQTAIQLYKQVTADVPKCEHTTTEPIAAVEATCTTPGKTAGVKCANPDCGEVLTAQEDVPALGHNYVGGVCVNTGCGEEEPEGMTPATQLVSGEYVIVGVAGDDGNYALPLGISGKMNGVEVTIDGDGILTGENLPVWTVEVTADGITLFNGTKYLGYGSSTNLAEKDTAYTWSATAKNDGFVIEDAESDSDRCVIFQVRDTQDRFRFGAYKTGQTSGKYIEALTFYKVASEEPETPVVQVGNKEYTSVNEALTEIAANGGTLKLLAPVENIAVDGELKLDLNGKTATNVTADKIYAYDSSATKTDEGTGALTTTSKVVTDNTVDGVRYIALNGNGTYTFHVLELKLNAVSLRAGAAGIYYKAQMNCDDTLAAATAFHGTVVSIKNMPGANFANETNGDVNRWTQIQGAPTGAFTTCSVFGIFKDGMDNATRGETKIYANAYIQLEGTDEIIVADTTTGDKAADQEGGNAEFDGIAWSLRDVMEKLDTMYSDMTDANKKASIVKFYENWADAMTTWSVANIAADATSAK